MPVDISIDPKNNLIRRTITGPVTMDEMIASLEDTLRHPDYRPRMNELADLRDTVHGASAADIQNLAQFVREHIELTEDTRTALVVSQTVTYGMARMLQMHLDGLPHEISVFYDIEEAERWLGVS